MGRTEETHLKNPAEFTTLPLLHETKNNKTSQAFPGMRLSPEKKLLTNAGIDCIFFSDSCI